MADDSGQPEGADESVESPNPTSHAGEERGTAASPAGDGLESGEPRPDRANEVRAATPEPGPDATEDIREAVLDGAVEYFEETAGEWPAVGPASPEFIRSRFFDFEYLDGATELERHWVKKPFAYVSVLHDEESRTNFYHASEPVLDEAEQYIRRDLEHRLRDSLDPEVVSQDESTAFEEAVKETVADVADGVPAGSLHKIVYYLLRDFDGYADIDPLMRDDQVEDISCDGTDFPVFVYHRRYRDLPTNLEFDEDDLDEFIRWLAQQAGRPVSFADPVVSATLPRGDRVQMILGSDISVRGSNFTIRRYQRIPFTPIDLILNNTFSLMEMAYLWLCIEHQKSTVFVGPTASGKTTSMNAVSLFIRPYAKVVSIERTRELSIPHDNWVSTVTRESARETDAVDVSVYDLLHSALHQRPEYILIGEIRTEPEVLRTFLQSVFTGHAGYTTFHAYDVDETVSRFQARPFDAEDQMISSIDIVSVQRQVYIDGQRFRRTIRISELTRGENGGIEPVEIFRWNPQTDSHQPREDLFESPALRGIADEHGWNQVELLEELEQRRDFLDYMVRNEIIDHRDVWASVFAFSRDRESVLEQVEAGSFDPASIKINYYD